METADSRRLDLYSGTMNTGPYLADQPMMKPADNSKGTPPPVGTRITHAKSGEGGVVTGEHQHGHSGERMPTVRWDGQPSKGFTQDQGYSLDSLTVP